MNVYKAIKNKELQEQAPGALAEEMADVLFVLICLANQT